MIRTKDWMVPALVFALAILPAAVLAQQEDEALAARVERLVDQLSDADFEIRDRATAELVELGEASLPALRKAAASDDPEVAWRAKKTIETIEARLAEKRPEPQEGPRSRGPEVDPDLEEMFRNLPGGNEEMRKMLEEAMRQAFGGEAPGEGGRFFFRNFAFEGDGTRRRTIETDKAKYEFETTPEGRIKGSVETRGDGEVTRREFAYDSAKAFQEADPELYAVYEKNAGGGNAFEFREGPFQFHFRMEGFEEVQRELEEMRKRLERAFGEGPGEPGEVPDGVERSIEKAMEEARRRAAGEAGPDEDLESYAGLAGAPVEAPLRAQLDVPEGQGLMLSRVEPESEAEAWGFRRYDLVLSAGGTSIETVEDFRRAIEALGAGESATFQIVRRGQRQEVVVSK